LIEPIVSDELEVGARTAAIFFLNLSALTAGDSLCRTRVVEECVFGVLALESEPVDPRL
jgi:hypothetical protein